MDKKSLVRKYLRDKNKKKDIANLTDTRTMTKKKKR